MSVSLERPISLEEFLAWEERQELRWEFDGFVPMAMTGGTAEHSIIERNLIFSLTGATSRPTLSALHRDLKIAVAGSIRYPDAFVACTRVPRGRLVVTEPVVVFEVLSPSTASTDIGAKNEEYRDTPPIQRYVILYRTASKRQYLPASATTGWDISFREMLYWRCRKSAFPSRFQNYMKGSPSSKPKPSSPIELLSLRHLGRNAGKMAPSP